MEDISTNEIERQVFECMAKVDILPSGSQSLLMDGKLHRYTVQGDKGNTKNGYYCIYPDGWAAGYFGSWKLGESINWRYDARELDSDTQKRLRKWERSSEVQILREEREKQHQQEQRKASDEARARFEQLPNATSDHPYLKRKRVKDYGLKLLRDLLVVPLHDENGDFKTYQTITPNGEKLFYPGASTRGAFFSVAMLGAANKHIDGPILICEGYATGATLYEITEYPTVCAMNAGNLLPVAKALRGKFPNRKIFVAADNDFKTKGNPGLAKAKEAVEQAKLDGIFFPEFPEGHYGTDWNDYAVLAGTEKTAEIIKAKIKGFTATKQKRSLIHSMTGNELMTTAFPDIRWAVEGVIPDGCSILAGPPKVGKSIFALNVALAVALGGLALGSIEVERGDVLYLALEDTWRRLKSRIEESGISETADLLALTLVRDVPRQHDGGLAYVEDWLSHHKDARLVIIDTLQKFRKPLAGSEQPYGGDYDAVAAIKQIADEYGVAVLLIHHTRKAKDDTDWLSDISGTLGLSGAADTLMVLRRGRNQAQGVLSITGRDVEEKEYALSLGGPGGWALLGDAGIYEASEASRKILDYLQEYGGQTPKELADSLKINYNTVRTSLARLLKTGAAVKDKRNYYAKESEATE